MPSGPFWPLKHIVLIMSHVNNLLLCCLCFSINWLIDWYSGKTGSRHLYQQLYKKLVPMHVTKIVRFDWSTVFESFWDQIRNLHRIEFYSVKVSGTRFLSVLSLLLMSGDVDIHSNLVGCVWMSTALRLNWKLRAIASPFKVFLQLMCYINYLLTYSLIVIMEKYPKRDDCSHCRWSHVTEWCHCGDVITW